MMHEKWMIERIGIRIRKIKSNTVVIVFHKLMKLQPQKTKISQVSIRIIINPRSKLCCESFFHLYSLLLKEILHLLRTKYTIIILFHYFFEPSWL